MRVFVTGATGFVGSAVVNELLAHGHQVLGLARSENGAAQLVQAGAEVHRGTIEDLDSLRRGAEACEAVAHLAFNHDFSRFEQNALDDAQAIAAIGEVLLGSDRPLLVTSGVALLAPGRVSTEADKPVGDFPRKSEEAANALAQRGVRATAVRLPPTTHGVGDHGFVAILKQIAEQKGVSAYIGGGANRWPAGHRLDAAKVYRLGLEQGGQQGPYHAVAEEGVPMRDIAAAIGAHLNVPVVSKGPEEAQEHFGWFGMFVGVDAPASSARTREALGWTPTGPTLLEDLARPDYYGA